MSFIVSANYRDRTSPFKWLVRQSSEHPESAIAYKRVDASGVTFKTSDEYERGFGCSQVAECVSCVGYEPEPKGIAGECISFNGMYFEDNDGNRVHHLGKLILGDDGRMYGVGLHERPAIAHAAEAIPA